MEEITPAAVTCSRPPQIHYYQRRSASISSGWRRLIGEGDRQEETDRRRWLVGSVNWWVCMFGSRAILLIVSMVASWRKLTRASSLFRFQRWWRWRQLWLRAMVAVGLMGSIFELILWINFWVNVKDFVDLDIVEVDLNGFLVLWISISVYICVVIWFQFVYVLGSDFCLYLCWILICVGSASQEF